MQIMHLTRVENSDTKRVSLFWHTWCMILLAVFLKVPKIQRPKALKIDVFNYSTVI